MATDYNELKHQAANFYLENQVPQKLEEILNTMFYENPTDVYGRLADYFDSFAHTPSFDHCKGQEVLDSGGNPAIKCSIFAVVKNHVKHVSSAQISLERETANIQEQQYPENESMPTPKEIVKTCLSKFSDEISSNLKGIPVTDQFLVDKTLSDWVDDVERLTFKQSDSKIDEKGEDMSRTPTPSSGKKKKPPSVKAKAGKAPDKPIPPREPQEARMEGCSSVSATSLAVLKSAASYRQLPVFMHFRQVVSRAEGDKKKAHQITMPTPAVVVLTGGKSGPGKLNLIKTVFVIANPTWGAQESVEKLCRVYQNIGKSLGAKSSTGVFSGLTGGYQPSYDKMEQPLDVVLEAITSAGFVPGQDVFIGLQICAQDFFDYEKGKYEISTGAFKSSDEMCEIYRDALTRYPAVVMIIDPLRKEDREQWPKLCELVSERCFVLGGEPTYGPLHSLNSNMLSARKSSGVALTTGGRVTCSDLSRIVGDVHARGGVVVMTSPPADVADDVYTDLGVGLSVNFLVFGAPSRGENTSRLNRFVEVERFANDSDILGISHREKFGFPIIKPPPEAPVSEEDVEPVETSPDIKPKKK